MAFDSYSIGEIEDSACHSTAHTHGKVGMLQIIELSKEDSELLIWRTGIHKKSLKTICLHHQKLYLDKFATMNSLCCDPFGHHAEKKNCKGI